MPNRQVHLKPEERDRLVKFVSQGYHQSNEIKHAYMLLHTHGGATDEMVAHILFCSEDSVRRTRNRYLNEGLSSALEDKPRSGREPALNAQQEAYLIALGCSDPPTGQERWTLELLTQCMVDDEQIETLSPETVRLTLPQYMVPG